MFSKYVIVIPKQYKYMKKNICFSLPRVISCAPDLDRVFPGRRCAAFQRQARQCTLSAAPVSPPEQGMNRSHDPHGLFQGAEALSTFAAGVTLKKKNGSADFSALAVNTIHSVYLLTIPKYCGIIFL